MDNPLYPTRSTADVIGELLGITIWLIVVAVVAFVIYRILRANGYLTRLRQNVDGHAARTGYSHGLKDGEQRAQQRHEINADQLTGALTRVEQQLADIHRAMNRPSPQAVVNRDTDRPTKTDRRTKDARPDAPTGPALSRQPTGVPVPAGATSLARTARRLGLRKPQTGQVEIPSGPRPQAQPTPPVPADVDVATTTTSPTPAPTSSS